MKLLGADTDLCAEAELKAVRKSGGGVHVDAGAVHLVQELLRRLGIPCPVVPIKRDKRNSLSFALTPSMGIKLLLKWNFVVKRHLLKWNFVVKRIVDRDTSVEFTTEVKARPTVLG